MAAQTFPAYRYYAGGRAVLVENQAELDALEPGHAHTPAGPFPEAPSMPERDQEAMRREARALREAGTTLRDIAQALGVSERSVRRYLEDDA